MSELQTPEDPQKRLTSRSFVSYLITQGFGAINDSMFRWLVVPVAKFRIAENFAVESGASAAELTSRAESLEAIAIAAGLACFVLPFVIFAPYAGFLGDRFSKRSVTIGCKIAEVAIMALGIAGIWWGNLYALFAILFGMGTQSAMMSPAKMGIIPEIVTKDRVSAANGVVGLVTVISVVIGTVAGNVLYSLTGDYGTDGIWKSALALLSVALIGWIASHFIMRVPAGDPKRRFPINPIAESYRDTVYLCKNRVLLRVTVGIAFFWCVAALAQMNIDVYVLKQLGLPQSQVGIFLGVLSIGVAVGSVLAGTWSGGRVELGIVPLGTTLIVLSSITLTITDQSPFWTAIMLFVLGTGGGLFNVPLSAYLQERSPKESLGIILSAGNLITYIGILGVSLAFALMRAQYNLEPKIVFLVTGIATIPILLYVVFVIPHATIRFFVWLISRCIYKLKVRGIDNLPSQGGALLVANHVSWVDGILISLASTRPIRMVAYADYLKPIQWLANLFGVIPIRPGGGPRQLLQSLRTAREAVASGDLVCIFAEGRISRTGQLLPFERGMMKIIDKTDAPVIPVYLDELWGSIFSFSGGKFLWKKPKRVPYPVTVSFGDPLSSVTDVHEVRQAVETLGVASMEDRKQEQLIPARQFIRQCKKSAGRLKVADSAGTELTGTRLLAAALLFRKLLEKKLGADTRMIGLLLPPSVGGAIANAAVTLLGRCAVNLNYTLSSDVVDFCIDECGITHVLTSRKFQQLKPFNIKAEYIYLEDLKEEATSAEKARAFACAKFEPASVLERRLGLTTIGMDDLITVIFTSGSTGQPKGVMLSHSNILSNLMAVDQLFNLNEKDVLIGVLPFFHSFGFTITMWLPFCVEPAGVYHYNPLDGRTVGKISNRYNGTILAATPTFLRTYLKRCKPEQFEHMNLVIAGAEKLPNDLADAFKEKFGIEITEGYGTTELSPAAAFNVPATRLGPDAEAATKRGTVGRVMPGATAKVIDPDTGADLDVNDEGLLRIKGPNVMVGYLNHEQKTAESIVDGWYDTGDMAMIDADGFISITGRMSRFSKIGGEMVPHIRIEEELARIVDDPDDAEPHILIAVTSVPDPKKGERLIVLHKKFKKTVDEALDELGECGLPNIWMPASNSFLEVEEIPLLGTGKLDLKGVKEAAMAHFGPEE